MTEEQRVVFRFSQRHRSNGLGAAVFFPLGVLVLILSGPGLMPFWLLGIAAFSTAVFWRIRVVVTQNTIVIRNWFRSHEFDIASEDTEFWFPGEPKWRHQGMAYALRVRSAEGQWVVAKAAVGDTSAIAQDGMSSLRDLVEVLSDGRARITIGGRPPPWGG